MHRRDIILLALSAILVSVPTFAQEREGSFAENVGTGFGLFGLFVLALVFVFFFSSFSSRSSERERVTISNWQPPKQGDTMTLNSDGRWPEKVTVVRADKGLSERGTFHVSVMNDRGIQMTHEVYTDGSVCYANVNDV